MLAPDLGWHGGQASEAMCVQRPMFSSWVCKERREAAPDPPEAGKDTQRGVWGAHSPAIEQPRWKGGILGPIYKDGETEARERQGHVQGHTAPRCPQLSSNPAVLELQEPGEGSGESVFPSEVLTVDGQGRGHWLPHSLQTLSSLKSHDQSCHPLPWLPALAACSPLAPLHHP